MSRGLAFSSSCPSGQRRRSLHSFFRTASKTLSSSIGLGVTTYTAVLQPCVLHSNRTRRVTQSMLGSCSDEVSALYTEANPQERQPIDRKSTRLNSSHLVISYAVFCLKK